MTAQAMPENGNWLHRLRREDWLLIFGVVAVVPLMVLQAQNLSERKHLQFYPIAWLCFCILVYTRVSIAACTSVWRARLGNFAMLFATAVAAFAVVRFSPWLSQVAAIALVFGWLLIRAGGNAWTQVVSWISILLITLPLPNNLDSSIIQRLQYVSTNSASSLLDLVSVSHVARGNVLEIRTGELFVDEACSGIDSLYSLAAIALILVVWNRSSFSIALATLATIPLWAWLGNLIRIFLIAYLLDGYDFDLSTGWPHTLLGLAVFSASAFSLVLTHRIAKDLLTPFPVETITTNYLHRWFNRFVAWPAFSPTASRVRKLSPAAKPTSSKLPVFIIAPVCLICSIIGFATLLPLYGVGPWDVSRFTLPSWTTEQVATVFREDDLPQTFMGLTRRGFSVIHRETGSVYGEHSATWSYQDNSGQEVQVSCDFPFPGFHGLEQCYTAAGQEVVYPILASVKDDVSAMKRTLYTILLRDNLAQMSTLLYTNFDSVGNDIAKPLPSVLGPLLERPPVAYQAQVFLPQCGELSPERKAAFEGILMQSTIAFIKKLRELKEIPH